MRRLSSAGRIVVERVIGTGLVGIALLASACGGDSDIDYDEYISPMDGQTGWNPETALVVVAEGMDIPPDYPLPDLIRVLDLDFGGFVPGRTERFEDSLRWTPLEPLPTDCDPQDAEDLGCRFGWVVDVPEPVPHGPELSFPDILEEPAVFDTSTRIDVLGGSIDAEGQACLVMSRKLTAGDTETWTLEIDGEELTDVVGSLADPADWAAGLELPEGDDGVDVLCFEGLDGSNPDDPPFVEPGDRVRLTWGQQGPWVVEMDDGPILDTVERLRRRSQ